MDEIGCTYDRDVLEGRDTIQCSQQIHQSLITEDLELQRELPYVSYVDLKSCPTHYLLSSTTNRVTLNPLHKYQTFH